MVFNTLQFLPFLALVLIFHYLLPWKIDKGFLLLASMFFYATFDPPFLLLLIAQSLIDWTLGRAIGASNRAPIRKALLVASLFVNLGVLFFFKYLDLVADLLNRVFALVGVEVVFPGLGLMLPVGISFYTFHMLSYIIDVYRRRITPAPLIDYLLFVTFFTQLVAGPIVRAGHMLPQFRRKRRPSFRTISLGAWLVILGYFKKIVIADGLANYVGTVFNNPSAFGTHDKALALLGFSIQIYGDFSGYTDIAIGLCCFFGLRLRRNFRWPYLARGMSDFWRRWHISLSSWIRDYVYIPLGGSRIGRARTAFNLIFVMTICGLWHGATWLFALWGALHGIALAIEGYAESRIRDLRAASRDRIARIRDTIAYRFISTAVTVCLVAMGWAFFRAGSVEHAIDMALSLPMAIASTVLKGNLPSPRNEMFYVALFCAVHLVQFARREITPSGYVNPTLRALAAAVLLFFVFTAWESGNVFIYFQF